MKIGTLDDWIERKLGPKRATPAKRMEQKSPRSHAGKGERESRAIYPPMPASPIRNHIDRIAIPPIAPELNWLYQNGGSRG